MIWLYQQTEFVFNVCESLFTELFLFMTNYDFHSKINFIFVSIKNTARKRILTKIFFDIFDKMNNISDFIKKKLASTQKSQKRQSDKIKVDSLNYKVENLVSLFIKNIKTNKLSKKLNHKIINFYKVLKILKKACQLNFSLSMKIYNNFHIFLLRFASINFLIK